MPRSLFRDNSLSLALAALFLITLAALTVAGHAQFNADRRTHGEPPVSYGAYLTTGGFGNTDWFAVVTADDRILIYDRLTGRLRQEVAIAPQ